MKLTVIIFFSFWVITLNAQKSSTQSDRIKAQKIAFITEKVGLTSETAQKFLPVYNELSIKTDSIHKIRISAKKRLKDEGNNLDNKQKEIIVDNLINCKQKEAELIKEYHEKFKKILSIDQLILLYDAEQEFKLKLIKQIRESEL